MSEYHTYYHHTDRDSAKKIAESGVIRQSKRDKGDAAYGDGTYLTRVGPSQSREKVALNNYDGMKPFYQSKIADGKTDVAFAVKLPASKVKDVSTGGRDIHLYKGDLKLSKAKEVNVYVRDGDKVRKFEK